MKLVSERSGVPLGHGWSLARSTPQVLGWPAGGLKTMVPTHAIDEHALADLECRHHRLARNAERLDEEGLDAERQPQRHRDDDDQLDQRVVLALLLASCHPRPGGPS